MGYNDFLKGKRVVLIGPSWHTKGMKQSKLISSYDIVVRMNMGYKYPKKIEKDIGGRTDIFYCAMSNYFFKHNTFEDLLKYQRDIKWIVGTGHHPQSIEKVKKIIPSKKIKFRNIDKKSYKKISSNLSKKVSCGYVVICDLLTYDIKELYVIGITFYHSDFIKGRRKLYYSGYNDKSWGLHPIRGHDTEGELQGFIDMYLKDDRLKCDDMLLKIINKYRDSK